MALRINRLSTENERNAFFREKCFELAEANGVNINFADHVEMNRLYQEYGNPSAAGVFIYNGAIYMSQRASEKLYVEHELVFHEILHILSVPIEFRSLMNHDTEASYKIIKKMHNDLNRISTESAVIGAQAILYERLGGLGWLGGRFFKGHIRNVDEYGSVICDVPSEWKNRGKILLSNLVLEFT